MPEAERIDGNLVEFHSPPTPLLESASSESDQEQGTQNWFDRVQQRLGKDPEEYKSAKVLNAIKRSNMDPLPTTVESRHPCQPPIREAGADSGDTEKLDTLEDIHQLTQAVAGSVNIIDHQFKLSILKRVGDLEKEVKELQATVERCSQVVKGLTDKLQWRKGVPCDLLERMDSMTSFTYAFCKGMEDAGIFQLRKYAQ